MFVTLFFFLLRRRRLDGVLTVWNGKSWDDELRKDEEDDDGADGHDDPQRTDDAVGEALRRLVERLIARVGYVVEEGRDEWRTQLIEGHIADDRGEKSLVSMDDDGTSEKKCPLFRKNPCALSS